MNVLIDTSAIYALLDNTDKNHVAANVMWPTLVNGEDLIVVSSYTVNETIALLHHRRGMAGVRVFVDEVLPALEMDWADYQTYSMALSMMLATEGKKGPSLTDCANLETMRRLRIHTIFAYDKHYERPGITVIGAGG